MVKDPKDYRWCVYSEAVAGKLSGAGLAVGRESFVESVFAVLRESFAADRSCGARKMRGGSGWDGMCVARALRVKPVDPGD